MKQVFILNAFRFAFEMIRKNLLWVIVFSLIISFLEAIRMFSNYIPTSFASYVGLISLILLIPEIMIYYKVTMLGLKAFDRENKKIPHHEAGFPSSGIFWQLIAVSFLFGILSILGLIVLVIPLFIVITTYMFCAQILIDSEEDISTRRVFRISEILTDGVKWKLMGYVAIMAVPYVATFALAFSTVGQNILWSDIFILLISLIIYPIQLFSTVYLYKSLKQQSNIG